MTPGPFASGTPLRRTSGVRAAGLRAGRWYTEPVSAHACWCAEPV
ncbi:hypothetical protein [Nonomuraea rhodomycinica]|nr:hypothetical protein [Nonomuraea rhodomycinica]